MKIILGIIFLTGEDHVVFILASSAPSIVPKYR